MLFLRVRCFGPLDQLASDPPAAIDVRRFILKRELARNLPAFLEVFQSCQHSQLVEDHRPRLVPFLLTPR